MSFVISDVCDRYVSFFIIYFRNHILNLKCRPFEPLKVLEFEFCTKHTFSPSEYSQRYLSSSFESSTPSSLDKSCRNHIFNLCVRKYDRSAFPSASIVNSFLDQCKRVQLILKM